MANLLRLGAAVPRSLGVARAALGGGLALLHLGQHPGLEIVSLRRLQARCERCAHPNLCALRPQHWLKNLLTFVPLFAAHVFLQPSLVERTLLVFLAFCCCASSSSTTCATCPRPVDIGANACGPSPPLRECSMGRCTSSTDWIASQTLCRHPLASPSAHITLRQNRCAFAED